MEKTLSKIVLITGCSSGIGKATALYLVQQGWTVYATARKVDTLEDLKAAGCHVLALDVTSENSMHEAVATVEREHGAVGVLINNAGYSQSGAIEAVPLERIRAQFETNIFGAVKMTQLVLPAMRQQHWGKIVNLSSMGGRLTFPGGGYYHATKYAIESITDALRFEVKGFGINAILIEPGLIRSSFSSTAVTGVEDVVQGNDPYQAFHAAVARSTKESYERGPLARLGGEPLDVAKVIAKAISSPKPKARYTVTASASFLITLRRLLPDSLWDQFVGSQFPQPH